MIPWGVMAICQVIWARHSDRTGERRWHSFLGYLLAAAGLLSLAVFSAHEVASIIALTMVTTGLGFAIVTFWPLAHRYLAGPAAVTGIAFINSFGGLGGYFGPALIGWIGVGQIHGGISFLPLAAIALAGGLIQFAVTADDK
jgi:ACS family tartrate transporter-like MFS transporter